jgi:hypothetical protein
MGLALLVVVSVPVKATGGFVDVPVGSVYYEAITDLASRSVIVGYADGRFDPSGPIMRQQFAKLIVKTLGVVVTGNETSPFTDVPTSSPGASDPFYPGKYIAVCYQRGWMSGDTATSFAPLKPLSLAELVAIAARATDLSDPPESYDPQLNNVPADYYQWVRKAAYAGVLAGLEGMGPNFDFTKDASRAECAQVIYALDLRAPLGVSSTAEGAASPSTGTPSTAALGAVSSVTSGTSGGLASGPGQEQRSPATRYLVIGLCLVALGFAAAVVVVARRRDTGPKPARGKADAVESVVVDGKIKEEFDSLLTEWDETTKKLPPLRTSDEEFEGADLWEGVPDPTPRPRPRGGRPPKVVDPDQRDAGKGPGAQAEGDL